MNGRRQRVELRFTSAQGYDGRGAKLTIVLDSNALAVTREDARGRWSGPLDPLADVTQMPSGKLAIAVAGERFDVPTRKRRPLLEMLTAGVLLGSRSGNAASLHPPWPRHVEPPGELEGLVLGSQLDEGETLLAWLATGCWEDLGSPWSNVERGKLHFLLTDTRTALVGVSALAPPCVDWLPAGAMAMTQGARGVRLRLADRTFLSRPGNALLFRELAPVTALSPQARLREVARLNCQARPQGASGLGLALLGIAARGGDDLAPIAAAYFTAEDPRPPEATTLSQWMTELRAKQRAPGALADLWLTFGSPWQGGELLLRQLRELGEAAEPYAVELHERMHAHRGTADHGPPRLARELELASHLLQAERPHRSLRVVEQSATWLPPQRIPDLVPPDTGSAEALRKHRRLAAAAEEAVGRDPLTNVHALAALSPLDPLAQRRLAECARRSGLGPVAHRAEQLAELLERPWKTSIAARATTTTPDAPTLLPHRALSRKELQRLLPTGAADEFAALIGRVQSTLARSPTPDRRTLDTCAERLGARFPRLHSCVQGAARLLALPEIEVFVARGQRARGLRSYESPTPCILLGGEHLDEASSTALSESELCFALGSEAAHIRFGETRVTSLDVWLGALDMTGQGLQFALSALPALAQARSFPQLRRVLGRLPLEPLDAALRGVTARFSAPGRGLMDEKSNAPKARKETLIAAHRLMLFRADRMGLLCCGGPAAALRAVVLLDHRGIGHRDELTRLTTAQALELLARSLVQGERALALRMAAAFSFWLSHEYADLRAVAEGDSAPDGGERPQGVS